MAYDARIEREAKKLLDSLGIVHSPISVEEVAQKADATLMSFDLGADVSGVLQMKSGLAIIGYNPNESKVGQRFTIAHELGHLILKHGQGKDNIFVDNENHYSLIKFRSSNLKLSPEDYQQEIEANCFAAALLMPAELVQKEISNYTGFDLSDSSMITDLARKFEVSAQAMSFRIINLSDNGII